MIRTELEKILDDWYPTWGKGGWLDHTNCMCDKCKEYRIAQAILAIKEHYLSLLPKEKEIQEAIDEDGGGGAIFVDNVGFNQCLAEIKERWYQ